MGQMNKTPKHPINIIVYDCEIIKLIDDGKHPRDHHYSYANGWDDFEGMGISVIGAWDYQQQKARVFMRDNLAEFQALIDRAAIVVGFNNKRFDDPLCKAHGVTVPAYKSFDIMVEILIAAGIDGSTYKHHKGYSLAATVAANIRGLGNTGNGANAPIDWQDNKPGKVIDYCLNDVHLTKRLVDGLINEGGLWSPKDDTEWLQINLLKGLHR